jgi:dienelactone hydrolase
MITKNIEYQDGSVKLLGFLAYDEKSIKKRPAVLVSHAWEGRNEFACEKAKKLAELGYVGFALDMFGNGKLGKNKDENAKLIQPFLQDRTMLRRRINSALDFVKKLEFVDPSRIAAIGFCFGGLCVLDLARSGADLRGVVSFHGLFLPESNATHQIKAKILALHGNDDPLVPPEQVQAFQNEMTKAKADWQLHIYGNTMHAFTNPAANDPDFGTVYNPTVEKRSWQEMLDFFKEIMD